MVKIYILCRMKWCCLKKNGAVLTLKILSTFIDANLIFLREFMEVNSLPWFCQPIWSNDVLVIDLLGNFGLSLLEMFIFTEQIEISWRLVLLFKNECRFVAKYCHRSILNCSSKSKKFTNLTISACKKEYLLLRISPSGWFFHST